MTVFTVSGTVNHYCCLPLMWESWSWSECGVGIVPICDVSAVSMAN